MGMAQIFASDQAEKAAGILCVFQGFFCAELEQKDCHPLMMYSQQLPITKRLKKKRGARASLSYYLPYYIGIIPPFQRFGKGFSSEFQTIFFHFRWIFIRN